MNTPDLDTLAGYLGVPSTWLDRLITFESGFNPQAKNPISGARGLIQFTDTTARNMGFTSALDLVTRYPDISSQLRGPVRDYLTPFKPFPTAQSLYMAVFYPAARKWPLEALFPLEVQKDNPGINTVGDYVSRVQGIKLKDIAYGGSWIILSGIALYVLYKQSKRGA